MGYYMQWCLLILYSGLMGCYLAWYSCWWITNLLCFLKLEFRSSCESSFHGFIKKSNYHISKIRAHIIIHYQMVVLTQFSLYHHYRHLINCRILNRVSLTQYDHNLTNHYQSNHQHLKCKDQTIDLAHLLPQSSLAHSYAYTQKNDSLTFIMVSMVDRVFKIIQTLSKTYLLSRKLIQISFYRFLVEP